MGLDDDELSLIQGVEEIGPRHHRERGRAGRERAGPAVRERHRLVRAALELEHVEDRAVRPGDEDPVRAERVGDRLTRPAAGQCAGLRSGVARDDVHDARGVERV